MSKWARGALRLKLAYNCQLEITCSRAEYRRYHTAEKLSYIGVITLYILSIATFIVLQSIFPQPTDNNFCVCSMCMYLHAIIISSYTL